MHCQEMPHHFSCSSGKSSPNQHPPPLVPLVSQDITWTCKSSSGIFYSKSSISQNISISWVPLPGILQELLPSPTANSRRNSVLLSRTAGLGPLNNQDEYISGVRQLQISHGNNNSGVDKMLHLQQVLQRVKVECKKKGKPTHSRLPITPEKWECHFLPIRGSHSRKRAKVWPYNKSLLQWCSCW